MAKAHKIQPPPHTQALSFRSGAVARMAHMPVSTLRIWEQRYQAVRPTTAPSGHRLYTAAEVERVVLLRQLTQHGHAIGSLAGLGFEQLHGVALAHATTPAQPAAARTRTRSRPPQAAGPRTVVVGQAMALRLQRPAVRQAWAQPPQVVQVFDSLTEAAEATHAFTDAQDASGEPIDLLLWQASGLHAQAAQELKAAQAAWQARTVAVAYRFSHTAARSALTNMGAAVAREPASDEALGAWLASIQTAASDRGHSPDLQAHSSSGTSWALAALSLTTVMAPERRFDDAALTAFAGLSSTVACECPSHLAELLMQLASFETYSADCTNRSPADADLHAYLQRVAGAARSLFETALERVAVAEGLPLPQMVDSPL